MIALQVELKTEFHRSLDQPAWVSALERFVADRIQAAGAFKTCDGTGTISSSYSVRIERNEQNSTPDRFEMSVEYDPESPFSSLGRERVFTVESHARMEAEARQLKEEWIASLKPLEAKDVFDRRQCPDGFSKLIPRFFPEGRSWAYCCADDPSHESSVWRGVRLDPGGWWTDFVADRTCPRCGSPKQVVGLLYGLVLMEVEHELWELGGCVFDGRHPKLWYCRACSLDFA